MVFPRTLDVDALAAADRDFEGDGEMPALVVEVLSPSNRSADVDRKVAQYLSAGVPRVWVVDPPARTVTVHRPDADPHPVPAAGTLDGGDALPGLNVPVGAVFGGAGVVIPNAPSRVSNGTGRWCNFGAPLDTLV